jgi:hypothetical protein
MLDLARIYSFRFRDVEPLRKMIVWRSLTNWIQKTWFVGANVYLDPACGTCDFLNEVSAPEKWGIDLEPQFSKKASDPKIKFIFGSNLEVDLPKNFFEAVFVSNFLEHLNSQDEVALFLNRMFDATAPKGRIAIMGPNFKYCSRNYFDFADHKVILTEKAVEEHLHGAGFNLVKTYPRFLPLTFKRSFLSHFIHKYTINTYLKAPFLWGLFGKQFLVIAEKAN